MNNISIGRKDVIWTYLSVCTQVSNNIILLPFILRIFSREAIAVWIIFSTIMGLASLLDFGFSISFSRSVSYVFSGTKALQTTGYTFLETTEVNYSLLKGLINAMRWFYSRIALILLFILATGGTYYIYTIVETYSENQLYIYISWAITTILISYSFYTLYYDALLLGKGLVKCNKQITVISQIIYLVIAIVLIFLHFNLIAIVSAKAFSIFIMRFLSYRVIYTKDFKSKLETIVPQSYKGIVKSLYPNALKTGLIYFGGLLSNQFVTLIGPSYLSLKEMASYGITIQIIGGIASLANVYYLAYQPSIVQYRLRKNKDSIKRLYLKGVLISFLIFIICGLMLLGLGNWIISLIGSQTPLLSNFFIAIALLICFLETNYINAAGIILTKNEAPFFKASLCSIVAIFIALFLFFQYTSIGVWGMILARGIVQGSYQIWKWPMEVFRELKIKKKDFSQLIL